MFNNSTHARLHALYWQYNFESELIDLLVSKSHATCLDSCYTNYIMTVRAFLTESGRCPIFGGTLITEFKQVFWGKIYDLQDFLKGAEAYKSLCYIRHIGCGDRKGQQTC